MPLAQQPGALGPEVAQNKESEKACSGAHAMNEAVKNHSTEG